MKFFKSALIPVALVALSLTAFAQQSGQTPTQAAAPAALPKGKIAVINTAAFQEQIQEFKTKLAAIDRQFEPRTKEIQTEGDQINALENTIKTQSNTLSAARVAELTEQVATRKRNYQRKVEDLQSEAGRVQQQTMAPVTEKLGNFAKEYTAKRGIVMLIDLGNALQSGTVVWWDPKSDVTQDFINEYNKAYPVQGAAPATPAPSTPAPVKKP
ncbi:MAG TPA: OmpH family outer membrane protein [Blastocatellia bacterium]|nr:OmpH family outer membrane protein [Blastocatellia bacterium]